MVLQGTMTCSPASVAPAHALNFSGAFHTSAPVAGAGAPAALAVGDGGRRPGGARSPRDIGPPQWPAVVDPEAVQRAAVRLVHAFAEHYPAAARRGRADGRQLDARSALGPERR